MISRTRKSSQPSLCPERGDGAAHLVDQNKPEEGGKEPTRYFLSSLSPDQGPPAAKAVRGHWMVENANHYKRDTCQWREDDHSHRRIKVAPNMALTCNALRAIIPCGAEQNLRTMLDEYHSNPREAIALILQAISILVASSQAL